MLEIGKKHRIEGVFSGRYIDIDFMSTNALRSNRAGKQGNIQFLNSLVLGNCTFYVKQDIFLLQTFIDFLSKLS